MKRPIVTAISLLFLAAASLAEVSGERPVSEPAYGPPPGQRYGTAAASDGRDFLVAWVDSYRNQAAANQIYAARMNAAGDILDPLGIRLPTLSNQTYRVDVVFLGENYLVYWDERSPISPGRTALMGARISRDGVVLDTTPRMLADRATVNVHGAASNGNRTVIVFGDSMIVVDRNGNVVDGPRKVSPDSAGAFAAMVASNGRDFLVVWQRSTFITSIRLDGNGIAASPAVPVTTSPFSQAVLDLASDGESYVTIIREGFAVVAQHIGAAGEALEKSQVPLQFIIPGFAFTGGSYLLMDQDVVQRTIGVRRLDRTGQPVGSYVAVSSGQGFGAGATLASNGSDAGFFWTDWTTSAQLFSATIVNGQSLAASKTTPIIRTAKTQTAPAGATSGRNHAVVWNEDDGLYAGRITLDGQLLDGRGIRIGKRAIAEPRIVYDGANYVIGWIEVIATTLPAPTVKIARMSPDTGVLLDPAGIVVASSQWAVGLSLAPGSSSTLVAWSESNRIIANTFSRDGLLGMPVTVTPSDTMGTGSVSTAWNGHEWLVAWEDRVPSNIPVDPSPGYLVRIFASRLSASLNVLDPRPIVVSNTLDDNRPYVASNGDSFLIVWTRYSQTSPYFDVIAQRVSSDGSLLAQANGIRFAGGEAKSVAWDGLQYDVALSSHVYNGQATPYDLFVTHVAATGSIESLNPLAVITNAIDPDASLIVTGTGRATTVYTRLGTEPQYGDVERAFVSVPHVVRGRASR
jgi:hypothetical protein